MNRPRPRDRGALPLSAQINRRPHLFVSIAVFLADYNLSQALLVESQK